MAGDVCMKYSIKYKSVVKMHEKVSLFSPKPCTLQTLMFIRGRSFCKTSFQVGMEQGRDETLKNTIPCYRTMAASTLASNAMHLHP